MSILSVGSTQIMPEGQITIPKNVLDHLKLSVGDTVNFVCEEDKLVIGNPAVYAMKELQKAMEGEAEELGLHSEEDVIRWVEKIREEIWREDSK